MGPIRDRLPCRTDWLYLAVVLDAWSQASGLHPVLSLGSSRAASTHELQGGAGGRRTVLRMGAPGAVVRQIRA